MLSAKFRRQRREGVKGTTRIAYESGTFAYENRFAGFPHLPSARRGGSADLDAPEKWIK